MRFSLLDRIVELEAGKRITAVKRLAQDEEYFADHFPTAPVMPGVLMLETLVQTAAWLVRVSEGFTHSIVVLKEARSVKYANFVEPGQEMRITAELIGETERESKFKASAAVAGEGCVSARLTLERYNLIDTMPWRGQTDEWLVARAREMYAVLKPEPGS